MKIDLHIHTVKNNYLDRSFSYDADSMKEYVLSNSLDIIAITNHNLFDNKNFNAIKSELNTVADCLILPGIEISLETGHVLLIFEDNPASISVLTKISSFIQTHEMDDHYKMSVADFNNICCGHGAVIVPHYDKSPRISKTIISQIKDCVFVGEVDSPKKFYRIKKDETNVTPVYFSDIRIGESKNIDDYKNKSRFTYVDCDERSFNSLVASLKNNDTYLSKNKIPEEFDILNGTASASTGINVLLGKRSSGKTYTLNHISEVYAKNCLYIKQFDITKDCNDESFNSAIEEAEKRTVLDYVSGINVAFDILEETKADICSTKFNTYISSLKECADEKIADIYSKCLLYNYSEIVKKNTSSIDRIIEAITTLLDADEFHKAIIEKRIKREDLICLYSEFITVKRKIIIDNKITDIANKICENISKKLGQKSSVKQITKCNILDYFESLYAKQKFDNLIQSIDEKLIEEDTIFGKFVKKSYLRKQKDKRSWKASLKVNSSCNIDYLTSNSPSDAYLRYCFDSTITNKVVGDDRYLIFFKSETDVHNENGKNISGGQRAEYILLRKLYDYKMYDLVLIDEMESSFDNPFLNEEVISKIKMIGQTATVFISTHNNNLGVSLNPNYYIYHEVDDVGGNIEFKHYCGKINDDFLVCPIDGKKIKLSKILVDTMEANEIAYSERKEKYEIT